MLSRLEELERTQWLTRERIEQVQFEALKKLLIHCYRNIEFYKERFDSVGFRPEQFSDISEIAAIPYLTKEDIQTYSSRLVARNYRIEDLLPDSSGGSTGKPTNFLKDVRRSQSRRADQIRHDRWCGWDLGEKMVTLWGASRDFEKQPSIKTRLVEKYIYRTYGFNAFDITEEKVLEYLDYLKKIRPTMIVAYANVAYLFARIIYDHDIDMGDLRLKGLISSAETLTEEKRKAIESAFRCKALNRYGSREVGLIASECSRQEGLHINADNVLVEIEAGGKKVAPGESGEIIVTDLWNYGMPFVRFRMEDVATADDHVCSCGRSLPLIKRVEGRVSDFFVDLTGRLIHGEYFTHLFYGVQGIKQFQLIQEAPDRIILKIVPQKDFSDSVLEPIYGKIRLCLGRQTIISMVICEGSLVEASGKFRFTVSKLAGQSFNLPSESS